ncbi:hypothetical protein AVEN_12044-1 [Araneus ventricosus]|uniref:Uncharacterized protein n=1 Tax=Araneus ventricosus TaxID=182803 RepID=A0A4Y2J102_ARAVE|nr:hypothetical protein AVEN_12044-1 [Araneus ventricosus]
MCCDAIICKYMTRNSSAEEKFLLSFKFILTSYKKERNEQRADMKELKKRVLVEELKAVDSTPAKDNDIEINVMTFGVGARCRGTYARHDEGCGQLKKVKLIPETTLIDLQYCCKLC